MDSPIFGQAAGTKRRIEKGFFAATGGRGGMNKMIGTRIGIVIGLLTLALAGVAQGQDIAGDWEGSLAIGVGGVRIVLHVTKSPDGSLKAVMDSPDQGAVGVPIESIQLNGNKLKFVSNTVQWSYEGTVKKDGIMGNLIQGQNHTELDFKKSTTPIKLVHPDAPPSDIDGTWEGQVTVPSIEKAQHLSFHIKNTGDGLLGSFDDPELNVKNFPIVAITRKGSSIKIIVPQVGGEVAGKLNKDLSVISGDWNQTDHTYALTLKRSKDAPAAAPAAATPPAN
jgi:hypothetical protein